MKIKPIIVILLLAVLLRFWNINSLPSLNPDEAALGYNAYSLILTGLDEHGQSFPLHFKSFGDFKPGGYVYLAIPFIKFLGLTPLAVRLPNLILSVSTIYILYRLTMLLFSNYRLSLLSSLVLTLSPWHIHFSRGAWESSSALFFILLGIYLFYSYILLHKSFFLLLFPLPFIASLYFYHSARIIAPLILFVLLYIHKSYIQNHISKLIFPFFLSVLLTLPVVFSFINSGGTARFGGVGLTADYGPVARSEELLNQHFPLSYLDRILHNRRTLYLLSWAQKYSSHFNLNFLFLEGDEVPRSKSPDIGQFPLWQLPFLLLGLYCLIRNSHFKNHRSFLITFLLISPLASSLTFQAPSALRSLPLVIPLSILIAIGLDHFLTLFRRPPVYYFLISLFLISFLYFSDAYFIHAPKRYPFAWNSGFSQIIPYIESQKNNFNHIYLTNKYDQPYILYLFFSRFDPRLIQSQISLTPPDNFGFSTVSQIDNISFNIPPWDNIPYNSLIIASDESIPSTPVSTVNFSNASPAFKIYVK